MNTKPLTTPVGLPKLIPSVKAGFDAVANHISLILLPVALDLFLWLGPHFSLKVLFLALSQQILALPGLDATQAAQFSSLISKIGEQFNLAIALRTFPVGLTSLMWSQLPVQTPLGKAPVIELSSDLLVFAWYLIFIIIGLVAGTIFFEQLTKVVFKNPSRMNFRQLTWSALQVFLLTVAFLVLVLMLSMPIIVFVSVLALISPDIALFIRPFIAIILIWILVPLLFSPHGIFAYNQNALVSMLMSTRLVRASLPGSGLFLLAVLILSLGLDVVWSAPPDTSWLTLVGISGHAFVTTSLMASSFVYYRDIMHWAQETLQQRSTTPTPSRV